MCSIVPHKLFNQESCFDHISFILSPYLCYSSPEGVGNLRVGVDNGSKQVVVVLTPQGDGVGARLLFLVLFVLIGK